MGIPEQLRPYGEGGQPATETLDARHFYAAYAFDNAATRRRDITVLMYAAQRLGYPVRYWWLSEAMELQDSPDRLIMCVHHPSLGEDAGVDLYGVLSQAAQKHKVRWDNLEAAHVDEYRRFGKIAVSPDSISEPDGTPLFPEPETDPELLFTLTWDDVQFVADAMLGRPLNDEEIEAVAGRLPGTLDWIGAVEATIKAGQAAGQIGPAAEGLVQEEEGIELEPRVRQLPGSGRFENFENEQGHFGNVVRVYEGIDAEGQLYVRREWAIGEPPDDFKPHGWAWAYVPDSGDTLEQVLADLDEMVAKGILTPEKRVRSEAFYRKLFPKTE